MLFIGYFEGLDSQRGIAWRCADSLALKQFLGYGLTDATPEHSSLTNTRKRVPQAVHEQVFAFVLSLAAAKKLLKGKRVGVDATPLEANAAMKSIVRKDSGEDYKAYLRRLAQEAGIDDPNDDDLKKFDKERKKKGSNKEWQSPSDPDARIMKMKDGRTRLSYKAEHALDMPSGLLLAATIHAGDTPDGDSLQETLIAALIRAGSEAEIEDLALDNGYQTSAALAQCQAWGILGLLARFDERKAVSLVAAVHGGLAILTVGIFAWITDLLAFPALGPTAFILFATPTSESAAPRSVVLGHFSGMATGLAVWHLMSAASGGPESPQIGGWPLIVSSSLALAVNCGLLVRLSCPHPPACASGLVIALGAA